MFSVYIIIIIIILIGLWVLIRLGLVYFNWVVGI